MLMISQVNVHLLGCQSVCPFSLFFMDNSSYSFHPIALKLGGQLDHEVIQSVVF